MKLYTIKIEAEAVVRAASKEEARLAVSGIELGDMVHEEHISVHDFKRIPPGWDKDCIPFGDVEDEEGDELTLGEWMAKG